jgi:hypothetical protein
VKRLIAGFLMSVAALYALLFGLLAGAVLLILYGGIAVLAWLAGARRSRAAEAFPEVDLPDLYPVGRAAHPNSRCELPPELRNPLPDAEPDMEPGRKHRRRVELREIAESRDRDRRPPESA